MVSAGSGTELLQTLQLRLRLSKIGREVVGLEVAHSAYTPPLSTAYMQGIVNLTDPYAS